MTIIDRDGDYWKHILMERVSRLLSVEVDYPEIFVFTEFS